MTAVAQISATEMLNGALRPMLPGVSRVAWDKFIDALTIEDDRGQRHGRSRPFAARSNGGVGCFGISPRRLVDLGVLEEVFVSKGKAIANPRDKRLIAFLAHPLMQYETLIRSLKSYDDMLGQIILPAGVTRSGALALCHRLGPNALGKWQKHQEPSTAALFRRTNGLF